MKEQQSWFQQKISCGMLNIKCIVSKYLLVCYLIVAHYTGLICLTKNSGGGGLS